MCEHFQGVYWTDELLCQKLTSQFPCAYGGGSGVGSSSSSSSNINSSIVAVVVVVATSLPMISDDDK